MIWDIICFLLRHYIWTSVGIFAIWAVYLAVADQVRKENLLEKTREKPLTMMSEKFMGCVIRLVHNYHSHDSCKVMLVEGDVPSEGIQKGDMFYIRKSVIPSNRGALNRFRVAKRGMSYLLVNDSSLG